MKTYVYEYCGQLYVNLTNRCSNACEFCLRNFCHGVGDNDLRLNLEPTADEVIEDLQMYPLKKFGEVVFCGFGEPTYRLSVLVQVAGWLHRQGIKTRLNTNGQSDLINHRTDSAEVLAKCIDHVSVSLNASTKEFYDEICRPLPAFKDGAYDAVKKFIKDCAALGVKTTASVVDFVGDDEVEACRVLTESLGATFRARETLRSEEDVKEK